MKTIASLAPFMLLFVLAGATLEPAAASGIERTPIVGDVVHYRFEVPVGPGEHDRIALHRVVRERAPFLPRPAPDAVMLVHGDAWAFGAVFRTDAEALPAFLAERGVDVWGIDFRWALVAANAADLSFMEPWGLEVQIKDLRAGLGIARLVRAATGSGAGRLHLLGFSRGGQIGYAYLSAETQRPQALRHAKGFIPADIFFKSDVEAIRQSGCQAAATAEARLAAGDVADDFTIIPLIGSLAATAPDDPSPFFPPFTNRQLAIDAGAFATPATPVPFIHLVGGEYDEEGFPLGLLYTEEDLWFSFLERASSFQPVRIGLDTGRVLCDEAEVPFDAHLGEIAVPVLYLGAGGGYGEFGVYSTTLLGSTDVTIHLVNQQPPELRGQDLGHDEPFLATSAESLYWQTLLAWIEAH